VLGHDERAAEPVGRVAAVDARGVVQPRHAGTTVVTARLGPLAATATVLVTDPKKRIPLQFVRTISGQVVVGSKPTAPARPAMVTAHAGNGKALVVWSRPDDGGEPITGYDVFADGRLVGMANDTHTTITGLDPHHRYSFTVKAHNKLGDSRPSPASKPILPQGTSSGSSPCLPSAPTKLTAWLVGRTTVHVTWQAPPTRKGCAVSAVRIQSFPPSRSVLAAPGATSVDIPGLDTATQYDFAVTASFGQNPPQTSTRSTPIQTNSQPCWDGSYSEPCPVQGSGAQAIVAPINKPAPIPSPAPPAAVEVVPSVGPTPTPVEPPSSPVPASSAPGVIPPTTTAPITTSPPPTATQTPPVDTLTTPPADNATQPPPSTDTVPTTSEPPPPGETSESPPPNDASAPADATSTPTDTPPS
jgi:hypothetical protein